MLVDYKIDTVMYFRYKIINDTLCLRDIDNRITIGVINSLNSCELLFDNFREKKHKMKYIRVKMDTKDLDSSFVKEFIPN